MGKATQMTGSSDAVIMSFLSIFPNLILQSTEDLFTGFHKNEESWYEYKLL